MPKFESRDIILTKKLNNVVYEIFVKTSSDMVYVNSDTTLTEKLNDICELLTNSDASTTELREAFDKIVAGAPQTFQTFKEVWDYVNVNGNPKSELLRLIESKQSSEEGKGLSTNDFTNILKEKLVNDYTKEELNDKFKIVLDRIDNVSKRVTSLESKPNVLVSASDEDAASLPDYSSWYKIIKKD